MKKLIEKIRNFLCKLLGCNKCDKPKFYNLEEGMNIISYSGCESVDAKVVFKELMDSKKLKVVRWQNRKTKEVKELFYSLFPTPEWVNEIGEVKPDEVYYIKMDQNYNNFKF